jgi:hypothetical protein
MATESDTDLDEKELAMHALHTPNQSCVKPFTVVLSVSSQRLTMDVDTGAATSVVSERAFHKKFPQAKLKPSSAMLITYTGELMDVIGSFDVDVCYKDQGPYSLVLTVVAGNGPCLIGRDWLKVFQLDWSSIFSISSKSTIQPILDEHREVFSDELGVISPFKVSLSVEQGAKPRFHKARPVPFALKSGVEEELNHLEREGVLEKVDYSEWAAPIVAVPKRNGSVQLCGDYKVSVNPVLAIDQYPLPRPEDLFATLVGGQRYTTLDLSQAYNQLVLDEESRKFAVVNTHRGLYRYTRLPFGIASAPAVFQRVMDQILQGMDQVICYIDDILVTG